MRMRFSGRAGPRPSERDHYARLQQQHIPHLLTHARGGIWPHWYRIAPAIHTLLSLDRRTEHGSCLGR